AVRPGGIERARGAVPGRPGLQQRQRLRDHGRDRRGALHPPMRRNHAGLRLPRRRDVSAPALPRRRVPSHRRGRRLIGSGSMKLARVVRSTAWLLLASATACADDAGPSPQDTDTGTSGGTSTSTGPGPTDASGSGDTSGAPGSEASTATTGDGGSTDDATVDDTTGGPSVVVDDPIRVVYLADDATVGTDELWLRDEADYDAGPLRISHMLPAEAFISPFFPVSPDGRWLVYRMIQPRPGSQHELWAVDVSIAAPERAFRVDHIP